MNALKIKATSAPEFMRHLEVLRKLSGVDHPYPFEVYFKLLRLENKATRLTTQQCNGEGNYEAQEKALEKIRVKVGELLPNLKTFQLNGDPRGYALKVSESEAKELRMYSDWGGYGILAPTF